MEKFGMGAYAVGQMDVRSVLLITNPYASRRNAAREAAAQAVARLNELGVNVLSVEGTTTEHSQEVLRATLERDDIDAVVVCGGDGLINLALQLQAGSTKPLGVIPAGSGNDLARALGIPRHAGRAAQTVAKGFFTTIDLAAAQVSGRPETRRLFATVGCQGFDSLVVDRTNRMRGPNGHLRYDMAIIREYVRLRPRPVRLTLEAADGTVTRLVAPMVLCAVANTTSYGGGILAAPDADYHDGLLDVTAAGAVGRLGALPLIYRFARGEHEGIDVIRSFRARRVTVDVEDVSAYIDGERFPGNPIEYEVVPAATRVFVPQP